MKLSTLIATAALAALILLVAAVSGCNSTEGTPPAHNGSLPDSADSDLGSGDVNVDDVFSEEDVTPPTVPS